MLKEPHVIDLVKEDFGHASNGQLVAAAVEKKIVFRHYFEGSVIDRAILCRYPDSARQPVYFPTIDFRKARFIRAIEDYVIGSSRAIVLQAARGDATTAIRQIFGKNAMALIEMGRLPMAENCSADNGNGKSGDALLWMASPGIAAARPSTLFRCLRLVKG